MTWRTDDDRSTAASAGWRYLSCVRAHIFGMRKLIHSTGAVGMADSRYRNWGNFIPCRYRLNREASHAYPRYLRYHGILGFQYLPYPLNQVFPEVMPTIPLYFEIPVPTLPAPSGIFIIHLYNTTLFRHSTPTTPAQSGISRLIHGVPTHTTGWDTPVNTGSTLSLVHYLGSRDISDGSTDSPRRAKGYS